MLYLISTPIGNLGDITIRSVDTLREVDFILAEDTRVTRKILYHFEIQKEIISYHAHSTERKIEALIRRMKNGESVALCTDAGTPGISDPGTELISRAIENEIEVVPLPGPTALIPALQISGLPTARFYFAGFPPQKKGRNKFFSELAKENKTIVIYESPHRLQKTMGQMIEHFGGKRKASISRELTKMYEETVRGTLEELDSYFDHEDKVRGEFVIVVEGIKAKKK